MLIPPLMNRLQQIAPGIDLEVWEIGRDTLAAMSEGKIDLAIADGWTLKQCKATEVLFPETFTCLVRQDHPCIQTELTFEHYLALETPYGERSSYSVVAKGVGIDLSSIMI